MSPEFVSYNQWHITFDQAQQCSSTNLNAPQKGQWWHSCREHSHHFSFLCDAWGNLDGALENACNTIKHVLIALEKSLKGCLVSFTTDPLLTSITTLLDRKSYGANDIKVVVKAASKITFITYLQLMISKSIALVSILQNINQISHVENIRRQLQYIKVHHLQPSTPYIFTQNKKVFSIE